MHRAGWRVVAVCRHERRKVVRHVYDCAIPVPTAAERAVKRMVHKRGVLLVTAVKPLAPFEVTETGLATGEVRWRDMLRR